MTLRMLPGKALVKPDTVKADGVIQIPEYIQRVGRPSGILLQANTDDKCIQEALGKRVLLRTAVTFQWQDEIYFLAMCNQIMAVIDGDMNVTILNEIERCQWCKSAGEGNMLMDHDGYCIRCQRNKYGQLATDPVKDPNLKVTDDERERFGGTIEERLNKDRPQGKIFSFAGQTKRTHADVPAPVKPSLYVPPKRERIQPKGEGKIISAASLRKRSRYET